MRTGPRGKRRKIVGEELIRLRPGESAALYEVLECGHRQLGRYDADGLPCTENGTPAASRICRQCYDGRPTGPPGEVVRQE